MVPVNDQLLHNIMPMLPMMVGTLPSCEGHTELHPQQTAATVFVDDLLVHSARDAAEELNAVMQVVDAHVTKEYGDAGMHQNLDKAEVTINVPMEGGENFIRRIARQEIQPVGATLRYLGPQMTVNNKWHEEVAIRRAAAEAA